jgi:fructose-1,6-bisphosphatase/inositol monophosphatase family enzyme
MLEINPRQEQSKLQLLSPIEFRDTAAESVLAGAAAADAELRSKSRSVAQEKGDLDVGHHAIVTSADLASQSAVLSVLARREQNSLFLTEEIVKAESPYRPRMLTLETLSLLQKVSAYVIDELDGTSSAYGGHYEWSVSNGVVVRLQSVAGAVYAPCINGGELFFAARGNGAFSRKGIAYSKTEPAVRLEVQNPDALKNAYVVLGPDCYLDRYPAHQKLLLELGNKCRTTNSIGSAAVGLGLVAAGRIHALIQPLHSPWDWAAGWSIVEEAGGKVIFFEMPSGGDNTRIVGARVDTPRAEHYHPTQRQLGFVAAAPAFAEELWERLKGIQINMSTGSR